VGEGDEERAACSVCSLLISVQRQQVFKRAAKSGVRWLTGRGRACCATMCVFLCVCVRLNFWGSSAFQYFGISAFGGLVLGAGQ